jgi:hypothetical protein
MRNVKAILALVLLTASCDKSKESGTAPAPGSAAPGAPTAPASAPAAAAKSADLATLFPGKAPKLPPPFTPLGFQSSDDDAKKLLPEGPNKRLSLDQFGDAAGVELWANDVNSKAWARSVQLRIKSPVDQIKPKLEAAWGAPQPNKSKHAVWINLADGIQATLKSTIDGAEVFYEPVMDWQAFLGDGKGFGFEKDRPLLGMSPDAVEKAYAIEYYPSDDKKRMMLNFPQLPYSDNSTTKVMVDVDGGKVKSYQATLDFDGGPEPAKVAEQINARITQKWGKPSKKWLNYRNFGKKPTITVTANPAQYAFSVK